MTLTYAILKLNFLTNYVMQFWIVFKLRPFLSLEAEICFAYFLRPEENVQMLESY